MALVAITQYLSTRSAAAGKVMGAMKALMVPLMMATLVAVVASQIDAVQAELSSLLRVIPLYVAFLAVMVPLGILAGRVFGQDAPGTRAVVFSGATRNSLVVLHLALPETLTLVAVVVVTQTGAQQPWDFSCVAGAGASQDPTRSVEQARTRAGPASRWVGAWR